MDELISVIIPYYNSDIHLLDKAIESVLIQSYKNLEVIICDDGSSENHKKELNQLVNKYIKKVCLIINTENNGISHARNTAVKSSRGKWLVWLDADDTLDKDCLRNLIDASQGVTMVIGECYVHEKGTCLLREPKLYYELAKNYCGSEFDPLMLNVFSLQPQLVLKEAFIQVGEFNQDFLMAELTEFFLRFIIKQGLEMVKFISDAYYHYNRNQSNSISTNRKKLFEYRKKALYYYKNEKEILIDNIYYIGRSENSGMQTYLPVKDGDILFPSYFRYQNNNILIGEGE